MKSRILFVVGFLIQIVISFCTIYQLTLMENSFPSWKSLLLTTFSIYLLSIIIHEIGHVIVGLKLGYSIIFIVIFGIEIKYNIKGIKRIRISFSGKHLLSGVVFFDFHNNIKTDKELEKRFSEIRKICIGGPFLTIALMFSVLIMFFLKAIIFWKFILFILIGNLILLGCCFSSQYEFNDIDVFFNRKHNKILFYRICFNATSCGYTNEYFANKKKEMVIKILAQNILEGQDIIFICNTLWELFIQKKVLVNIEFLEMVRVSFKDSKCRNYYTYYMCFSIIAILYYDFSKNKANVIYKYIYSNQEIVKILKEDFSGASYFMKLMEMKKSENIEYLKRKIKDRSMRKIGFIF